MYLTRLLPSRMSAFPSFTPSLCFLQYQATRSLCQVPRSGDRSTPSPLRPTTFESNGTATLKTVPLSRPPLVYHPEYSIPWPTTHRFKMGKFHDLMRLGVEEGVIRKEDIIEPEPLRDEWVTNVHCEEYYNQFCEGTLDEDKMRRIGFKWSEGLVKRTKLECAGTVTAARIALRTGMCLNLAGGTHHAYRTFGSGFTILNDLAITAKTLLLEDQVSRVLVVDLDTHQGDGTASIFGNDDRVFTFSAHCESNFPFRKQVSDLDIPLPDGTDDEEYLNIVLPLIENSVKQYRPELILFDAGVDVHQNDELGRLNLSDKGLMERDSFVFRLGVKYGCPIASVIGGGYQKDPEALAHRHLFVVRAANRVWEIDEVGLAQWN